MTQLAHIGGLPVEEGVAALAPAGAALLYMAAGGLAWISRRPRPRRRRRRARRLVPPGGG